ncbi:MAG: glycosyltransferase family 39 protein [Deltaproteobacteria bacterium]|nr:glycosyltransferase family 39 protein [Deltaproteobacteria bacterium]
MNPESLQSSRDNTRIVVFAASALALAGLVGRLAVALTLPLFENDAVTLLEAARQQMWRGTASLVQTLPVVITAKLWLVFGEGLLVARLPDLFAGFGTAALVFAVARDRAGKAAGAVAALIYAAVPLAGLYGAVIKPYSLLSFFILAGIWSWDRAIDETPANRPVWSVISGLFFGAAFACHTFAAFAGAPLLLFTALGLVRSADRKLFAPSLMAGVAMAAVIGGLVSWRFPAYGLSVFNDYVADWRFDVATAVWSARWEGLTNLHALPAFLILPGAVYLLADRRGPAPWRLGRYLFYALVLNAVVYALNPVNHFPRVLLPAVSILSIFGGIGLTRAAERDRRFLAVAVAASVLCAVWLAAERIRGAALGLGFLFNVSTAGYFALAAVAAAGFFALAKLGRKSAPSAQTAGMLVALFGAASLTFGAMHVHGALDRQVAYFQGRLTALKACDTPFGNLGGGDVTHLYYGPGQNYSWLMDLDPNHLETVFRNDLLTALLQAGVVCVVVTWDDPEGEQAMLHGFAAARDLPDIPGYNVYQELEDNPAVVDVYATDRFSAYRLPWYRTRPYDISERERRYSPVWKTKLWSVP